MTAPTRSTRSHASARLAPTLAKAISFLGCALTLHATPAAAEARRPVPPSRAARHAAPPWSEVREGAPALPTSARVSRLPFRLGDHPAIHPERGGAAIPQRLFPRLPEIQQERRLRQDAIARHPAGKAAATTDPKSAAPADERRTGQGHGISGTSAGSPNDSVSKPARFAEAGAQELHRREEGRPYTVRRGDSLWSIAARASRRQDAGSIHALTQHIYRINRSIVGPDPDLILPGQILTLPADVDR